MVRDLYGVESGLAQVTKPPLPQAKHPKREAWVADHELAGKKAHS